ncbi:MAG: hypothetical protein IKB51_05290 [Clostridia bacterium]|nr:hypothetical protein [Clostridia bacterium]
MTNKKSTKSALISSVIALFLCFTMLLGTTFAWFTDSVASGSNVIQAGNLDIEVEYTLDGVTWKNLDGANDIFQKGLWEPGHTEIVALKLTNNGSLELNYTARMNIINEIVGKNKADEDIVLSEILKVNTITMDAGAIGDALLGYYLSDENALTDNESSFKDANILDDNAVLPVGTSKYVIIKVDMPETVGNEANAKDQDSVPSIEFGINVFATQRADESDSFGNDYDADAFYADAFVTTDEALKAAIVDPKAKVIAVKGDLTYDWGTKSYENSEALYMKGKTIIGFDNDSSITFAGYGSANLITDVTLKNITVKDNTVGDNEGAWEHGHLEFVSLTANNVIFANTIMLDGNSTLTDCSMVNNIASWYGIWIEGGNTVIKNCIFSGTRSVKIHEAYGSNVESVVIDDCIIGALSEKPGVVIGDLDATTSVTIKNTMFVNVQAGDQAGSVHEYICESDTDVTKFNFVIENNNVIGGATIAATGEEFIGATAGGDVVITDDIIYNNTDPDKQMIMQATDEIKFHGNGATITTEGADPANGNHGYVAFVPPAGDDVTVSDLTVTGEGFVEMGHYDIGGGDYVANNLVVKDLVSTLKNVDKGFSLACGFAHYGNAVLNDCTMTGTTAMLDGAMAVDAGFVNGTTTLVNGGKYGTIYCWSHAVVTLDDAEVDTLYVSPIKGTVTIKAGTEIDTLIVDYGTSAGNVTQARLQKLVIEDGATVNEIVYAGNTYTVDAWNSFVTNFGA